MLNLKLVILIILCVLLNVLQSEKLPLRIASKYEEINDNCIYKDKLSSGLIQILSYNTWGLPIELNGHDHKRRFNIMPASILQTKSDIIALQETFNPALRDLLLSVLPGQYYTYSDYRCERNIIPFVHIDCYGGLMTLSLFPITKEEFFLFPSCKSSSLIEKIGAKGFLVSQIQHGDQNLLVINTHLYAGNDKKSEQIRMNQMKYLHEVMSNTNMYNNDKVILVGDFNIQHPDIRCSEVYDYIVNKMGFSDSKPNIDHRDYTMDAATNKYVHSKEPCTKLDYIFTKSNVIKPIQIISQSRTMSSNQTLSDHYAWKACLKI